MEWNGIPNPKIRQTRQDRQLLLNEQMDVNELEFAVGTFFLFSFWVLMYSIYLIKISVRYAHSKDHWSLGRNYPCAY